MLSDRLTQQPWLQWSFSSPLAAAIASGCQPKPKLSPELEQAVDSVRSMTSQRWLSRSAFATSYPQAQPSNYVSYLFSDLGVAEWPIALDALEAEQPRSIGVTPLPPNVALVPQQPEPTRGKQLVLRADDTAGLVLVDAYEEPQTEPIASFEFALPASLDGPP